MSIEYNYPFWAYRLTSLGTGVSSLFDFNNKEDTAIFKKYKWYESYQKAHEGGAHMKGSNEEPKPKPKPKPEPKPKPKPKLKPKLKKEPEKVFEVISNKETEDNMDF